MKWASCPSKQMYVITQRAWIILLDGNMFQIWGKHRFGVINVKVV